jgi:hypothetical protein
MGARRCSCISGALALIREILASELRVIRAARALRVAVRPFLPKIGVEYVEFTRQTAGRNAWF